MAIEGLQSGGASLEWLYNVEGEGDNGFSKFYETVDTVLLGKRSYDWVMKQDIEEFPYKNRECYVFTRSSIEDTEDVKFVNDDVTQFVDKLKDQEGKNIGLSVEENCYILLYKKNWLMNSL